MRRVLWAGTLVLGISIGALGCAHHETVMVPPRIDLTQHEMIGVIDFDSSSSEGELAAMATRRFTESARRDQGLVRMIDFGPANRVLDAVGRTELDPDAFRKIGEERGVRTILVGELTISDIRPDLRIAASLRSGSLTAEVDATLEVRLIEAETGASIWSRSASATQSVAQVSVFGGKQFAFDASDPERAYGGLVDALVSQVTRDFHVGWERHRVR